nr:TolC family protein [Schlegelella koreensis]
MKHQRWAAPWLLAGAVTCAPSLAQTTLPGEPAAIALAQAVDAAWERAAAAADARGREQVALARQAAASGLTPQAPSVDLARRNGRSGANETELGVVAPFWTPGRRSALGAAAAAELDVARAAQHVGRWRVAGEVREAAWSRALHQADLAAAQEQLRVLQSLSADVDRRVLAGDLARADALVARAEVLGAEALLAEMQQRVAAATTKLTVLTGLANPVDLSEPDRSASPAEHPELVLARLEGERTRAQLESLRRSRRDPPEVAVSWRQERSGGAQGRQDSVGVALRIPFGTDARSGPLEAAALSELEVLRVQTERLTERQAADVRTAREGFETAQQQVAGEQTRAALLRERAQLLDKSFRAGETALPDLLRALATAAQADAALARQRAAVGAARARLNQSLGVTP